jgi:hypothetical protein
MQTTKRGTRIDPLCEAIILERLGDISSFPEELVTRVFHIYRDFIGSYLNLLRQKEGKPQGWFPESLSIDPALVDDMRHFFSDYQHITQAFLSLNKQINKLSEIDKNKQPNLYQHGVTRILNHDIGR